MDKREIGDICGFVSCFYLRGVIAPVQKKKHISVEFDRGSGMQDPNNFLEGSGKNRRHLKTIKVYAHH